MARACATSGEVADDGCMIENSFRITCALLKPRALWWHISLAGPCMARRGKILIFIPYSGSEEEAKRAELSGVIIHWVLWLSTVQCDHVRRILVWPYLHCLAYLCNMHDHHLSCKPRLLGGDCLVRLERQKVGPSCAVCALKSCRERKWRSSILLYILVCLFSGCRAVYGYMTEDQWLSVENSVPVRCSFSSIALRFLPLGSFIFPSLA